MAKNGPTTKEQVLALLQSHNASYISGQEIADTLYLTRAGVWKAVNSLREAGYNIEAVTNKGYRLVMEKDILSGGWIQYQLQEAGIPLKVIVYDEVGSTNDVAKELAATDTIPTNYLIVATSQTSGHGRKGRAFYSPKGCGLYFSLLLHPQMEFTQATYLTCMAAVAVCRGITVITGQDPKIKWVNDIFLRDRKVCGILTEGYTSIEDRSLSYVIVGMGMNLYPPADGFPRELKNVAGVICPDGENEENLKNRLLTSIVTEFMELYRNGDTPALIQEYRHKSMLIGHYVKIISDGTTPADYGLVEGIDDNCHLLIRLDNGTLRELRSGEVSVVKY